MYSDMYRVAAQGSRKRVLRFVVRTWLFNLSNRLSAVSSFSLGNWPPTIIVLPIVGIGSYLAPFKPWRIQDCYRLQMSQPSYP